MELLDALATCHVEGCGNAEIAIPVKIEDASVVFCGPCGNEITDVEVAA